MSNTKGKIFFFFFKLSAFFTRNRILKIVGFPVRALYKFIFQWIFGIDISDRTKIGNGFNVFHGQGLVVNSATIIGNNVVLRQNTTIGNSKPSSGSPIIHDNVQVGANCVIIGEITIGENSIIGAGSVVIKDVQENSIYAGNPAKFIKHV